MAAAIHGKAQPITGQCLRGSDAVASASPPANLTADMPITVATATTPRRRMIFVFKQVSLGLFSAARKRLCRTGSRPAVRPGASSDAGLAHHSIGVNTIEWPLMQ
jgi:hypothetical protein